MYTYIYYKRASGEPLVIISCGSAGEIDAVKTDCLITRSSTIPQNNRKKIEQVSCVIGGCFMEECGCHDDTTAMRIARI